MVKSVDELIDKVSPDVLNHWGDVNWFSERAILPPRINEMFNINLRFLRPMNNDFQSFESVDSVVDENKAVEYPTEFLNSLDPPSIVCHRTSLAHLTKSMKIMLLGNLSPQIYNHTTQILKTGATRTGHKICGVIW